MSLLSQPFCLPLFEKFSHHKKVAEAIIKNFTNHLLHIIIYAQIIRKNIII